MAWGTPTGDGAEAFAPAGTRALRASWCSVQTDGRSPGGGACRAGTPTRRRAPAARRIFGRLVAPRLAALVPGLVPALVPAALVSAALVLVPLALAPQPLAAAPYQFTATDGSYAVSFPAPPQEQVNEDEAARWVSNAVNHDNGYYAVVHVDNKVDHELDDELEDNVTKAAKQFNASTQLRKKMKITRGAGDQLPAEEFTFENAELAGKGMVIVDGRRTYMVLALGIKPHDHKAAVDRFIKSFKFKVAAPPASAKVVKGKTKPKADSPPAAAQKE
jgi:hypothetical protein